MSTVMPYSKEGAVFSMIRQNIPCQDIQQTNYRFYVPVTDKTPNVKFNLTGQIELLPGEHRISSNDGAVLYAMSLGVVKVNKKLGGNINNYPTHYYADKSVFNGPSDGKSQNEAGCIEAIYNGSLAIKSNNTIIVDHLSTESFRIVPPTQANKTGTTLPSYNQDVSPKVPFIQPYVFTGKDTVELTINFGNAADITQIGGVEGTQNYLVVSFDAFVLKNYAQGVHSGNLDQAISKQNSC